MPVWDGDILDLGDQELEAIAMPGHTPSSMTLLDRASGMLFSGDPIQHDGRIHLFGPMRSITAYVHCLERLAARAAEISSIWPCHATCPVSPETISELIEAVRVVERGEAPYTMDEAHGMPVRTNVVSPSVLLCDAEPCV